MIRSALKLYFIWLGSDCKAGVPNCFLLVVVGFGLLIGVVIGMWPFIIALMSGKPWNSSIFVQNTVHGGGEVQISQVILSGFALLIIGLSLGITSLGYILGWFDNFIDD